MQSDARWNDSARKDLGQVLREQVLGEVRLSRFDHDEIVETCRVVYIEDECPEAEWPAFLQLVREELERTAAEHAAEQERWPSETDCDRLDRVEAALREKGILLWQVSPCCDTCSGGELPDRIDEIERRHPGFRARVRGYSFFIDQSMADDLAESTELTVYLAYGWYSPDGSSVAPEVYDSNALGIAREVCDCLREAGFEPSWDGDINRKIRVPLSWLRRTMLT